MFVVTVVISLIAPMGHAYIAGTARSVLVSWMMSVAVSLYDRFESLVRSRDVLDNAVGAIGFFEFISSMYMMTVSVLVL